MNWKKLLARINKLEEMTLTGTLLGLAIVGAVQVFFRYVLEISFDWFEELGRYLGVFITFLGASLGVKYGVHFSMDMIVTSLKPPWRNLLEAATGLACAACFSSVAWFGFKLVIRNYNYETTSPAMQLPMFWAYLPIPLFSVFIAIRFLIKTCNNLKKISRPVADNGQTAGEAAK